MRDNLDIAFFDDDGNLLRDDFLCGERYPNWFMKIKGKREEYENIPFLDRAVQFKAHLPAISKIFDYYEDRFGDTYDYLHIMAIEDFRLWYNAEMPGLMEGWVRSDPHWNHQIKGEIPATIVTEISAKDERKLNRDLFYTFFRDSSDKMIDVYEALDSRNIKTGYIGLCFYC